MDMRIVWHVEELFKDKCTMNLVEKKDSVVSSMIFLKFHLHWSKRVLKMRESVVFQLS